MIAWITSIFGGIDEPKPIPEQSIKFIHYHFSEENNPTALNGLNDRMKALYFKTQMHRIIEADYFIWTDGKIRIISNNFIHAVLKQLDHNEFGILKHQYRKCIYKEVDHIEHCIKEGNKYLATRYETRPIRKEVEFYRAQGYPVNNGLNDCKIFIVKNTPRTNLLFDEWWQSCLNDSFDQIAIQFLAWKQDIKIIPLIFNRVHYIDVPHKLLK